MAKVFYTEHDIEDMVKRGERSLVVTEDVVLTDLAYESARRLGVELLQPNDTPPAAPIRPYINKTATRPAPQAPAQASSKAAPQAAPAAAPASSRLLAIKARVKTAVKAKLGDQIDDATLDRIIERVAADLGLK
jgi:hypothetical protein